MDERGAGFMSAKTTGLSPTRGRRFNSPHLADAYYIRGLSCYFNGEYDKALIDYDECLRLNERTRTVFLERGHCWYEKGQYDRALSEYDEAIRIEPGYSATYYNRGMAWHAQHEYDRAIVEFDEALRLKENCVYSFYMRGRVWEERRGSATGQSRISTTRLPETRTLRWPSPTVAAAGTRKGQLDRARKDMAEAFRLDATTRDGFCDAGRYWCNQGDYARAIEELDHAVRFNPTPDAFVCRGWAKSCVGDHEAALADFDEAIRLDPTSAKAFCCRGVTKFQMKNYAAPGATSTSRSFLSW